LPVEYIRQISGDISHDDRSLCVSGIKPPKVIVKKAIAKVLFLVSQ